VAEEEQRAHRRLIELLALLLAGVAVHHRPLAIEVLLTFGVGEVRAMLNKSVNGTVPSIVVNR
jgi:hypothetical protein